MFERMVENMFSGIGGIVVHEGEQYILVDQNSWKSDVGWVTCKLVVKVDAQTANWNQSIVRDVKALISVNP